MLKKYAEVSHISLLFSMMVLTLSAFLGLEKVWADYLIKTIPIEGVGSIAYNPTNKHMYVANSGGTVSVIDSSSNTVIKNITVGFNPINIAYNPVNHFMYVTNYFSDTVSVIDSSSNTVIKNISVSVPGEPQNCVGEKCLSTHHPKGIAYNPSNKDIYVANLDSATVSVIDSSSNTVIKNIIVGSPDNIAYNPVNHFMYVTRETYPGGISVIDSSSNTVIKNIGIPGSFYTAIAFNPSNNNMYATQSTYGHPGGISVIDSSSNTVIKTIPVGIRPNGIAFNPSNNNMYVTSY